MTVVAALAACDDAPIVDEKPASRFAAASKGDAAARAARAFCEQSFPRETAPTVAAFPERPLPDGSTARSAPGPRWVNLWATWCGPCIEEMGLLTRWRDALANDGAKIGLEMWSVDEDAAALETFLASHTLPGPTRWVKSIDDVPAVMDALELPKTAPIPVHALVDGEGRLRCVRAGAIHEEDYAAVKSLIAAF